MASWPAHPAKRGSNRNLQHLRSQTAPGERGQGAVKLYVCACKLALHSLSWATMYDRNTWDCSG